MDGYALNPNLHENAYGGTLHRLQKAGPKHHLKSVRMT